MAFSKLFEPFQVGAVQLQHRVVLAPLTRLKATEKSHVPIVKLVREYYAQRAQTPGTLLIAEGSVVAPKAGGFSHVPGLWSNEQLDAWKEITDAVHAKGSVIFAQLWALGRAADPAVLRQEGSPYISASPIRLIGKEETPRALTIEEIGEYVHLYAQVASDAVNRAGFDGVEIHGANGYLVDQFIQDVSNARDDAYGGSIQNRARFPLEIVDAVVKAVGPKRTAIRFSPWSEYQGMLMRDPKPTFAHLVSQLAERHPDLAYLHLIEPRVSGNETRDDGSLPDEWINDFLREIWAPRPLISAGAYTRDSAIQVADTKGDLIAFGRQFISNPDLPARLKNNIPLNPYDRATFYVKGDHPEGYIDYPSYVYSPGVSERDE